MPAQYLKINDSCFKLSYYYPFFTFFVNETSKQGIPTTNAISKSFILEFIAENKSE